MEQIQFDQPLNRLDYDFHIDGPLHSKKHVKLLRGTWIETGMKVALKVFLPSAFEEFYMESEVNKILGDHHRLVKAVKIVSYEEVKFPLTLEGETYEVYAYLVFPLYEKGTLLDLILRNGPLSTETCLRYFGQLSEAI